MAENAERAVAVVGVGAILPDAPDAAAFWENVKEGRYSITEVPAGRWDPGLYYDEDPQAPAKTYSRIGGWVQAWDWEPLATTIWVLPPATATAVSTISLRSRTLRVLGSAVVPFTRIPWPPSLMWRSTRRA